MQKYELISYFRGKGLVPCDRAGHAMKELPPLDAMECCGFLLGEPPPNWIVRIFHGTPRRKFIGEMDFATMTFNVFGDDYFEMLSQFQPPLVHINYVLKYRYARCEYRPYEASVPDPTPVRIGGREDELL